MDEHPGFPAWWNRTGSRLAGRAGLYPSHQLVRDLCSIAYHQGRVDTIAEREQELTDRLARLESPPE